MPLVLTRMRSTLLEIAMIEANSKPVADAMRLYLTHCSKEKNPALRGTSIAVTPDQLYTNAAIQQFMQRCCISNVHWAILSDLYGIYLSDNQHIWYEKSPDTVTPEEEAEIIQHFNRQLNLYDEIYFFIRPDSFHPFYARVLQKTILAERVKTFQDLEWIEPSVDAAGLSRSAHLNIAFQIP